MKKSRSRKQVTRNPSRPSNQKIKTDELLTTAVQYHRQGHFFHAEQLYQAIIQAKPKHADACHLLGLIAHERGKHEEAINLIRKAIRFKPKVAQYHYNCAISFHELGRYLEAIKHYREAIRLKPDYFEAYENLGVSLQDSGDLEAAFKVFNKALDLNPSTHIARKNRGTLLLLNGRDEEAMADFEKVLELNPTDINTLMKRACTLARNGKFNEAWEELEWRHYSTEFVKYNPPRITPIPKWDGSSLHGKTVLVQMEQGIGDEIMFASCLGDLLEVCQECFVECDPRLVNILEASFPKATILPKHPRDDLSWMISLPEIDWRIPAGSLPRYFRPTIDAFPERGNYLFADPALECHWRERIQQFNYPINIGISWRGGKDHREQSARSVALEAWRCLFKNKNINFISLQYGDHKDEITAFHRDDAAVLHELEGLDPLTSMDDLFAAISSLDLVISIDNSTVHAAGALGIPVWILLPIGSDWRWLRNRSDSPWYPSARLFRQETPGKEGWTSLVELVSRQLSAAFKDLRAPFPADISPKLEHRAQSKESCAHVDSRPIQQTGDCRQPKALLLNDTSSWYHWGCTCTSLAIHRELRKTGFSVISSPILDTMDLLHAPETIDGFDDNDSYNRFTSYHHVLINKLQSCSVVIINGEGTLHNVTRQTLGLLYLAYIAKMRLNKTVQVINHSCYPEDSPHLADTVKYAIYKKVYSQLDHIAIRETVGAELLENMGINITRSFDCLPLFIRNYYVAQKNEQAPYIVVAGCVSWDSNSVNRVGEFINRMKQKINIVLLIGANAYPAADDLRFVDMISRCCRGNFTLINASSENQWLNTIANSKLLVSGRFHHTIAAAFLGTPFLVMDSNTPKIDGLMRMLALDTQVSVSDSICSNTLCQLAASLIEDPKPGLLSEEKKKQLTEMSLENFSFTNPRSVAKSRNGYYSSY